MEKPIGWPWSIASMCPYSHILCDMTLGREAIRSLFSMGHSNNQKAVKLLTAWPDDSEMKVLAFVWFITEECQRDIALSLSVAIFCTDDYIGRFALYKRCIPTASLVAQWLRIRLPLHGTRVWALVREDPTCCGATKPARHNYWACALEPTSHNYWSPRATTTEACAPRARALQQEKPPQWEVRVPQWRVAPARCK